MKLEYSIDSPDRVCREMKAADCFTNKMALGRGYYASLNDLDF